MIYFRLSVFTALLLLHASLTSLGTGQQPSRGHANAAAPAAVKLDSVKHLPNAHRLPGDVLSGGLPADEQAFQELVKLGVKTVVSVDGAPPNVALAQRFGLRYVHLPIGYDGIRAARVPELAKAVHDLPRPLYIHCHHGKHRSPAAAVVACIANGLLEPEAAEAALKQMGTAPHYVGLYASAKGAQRLDPQQLAQLEVPFPAVVPPPPLIHAMLEIEHLHDQLAIWKENNEADAQNASATSAAHLALLLKEQFVEMQRLTESQQHGPAFTAMLQTSTRNAAALEAALRHEIDGSRGGKVSTPLRERRANGKIGITTAWQRVSSDCKTCHRRFRDAPAPL